MGKIIEIAISGASRYGYMLEQKAAWIGLKTNEGDELRVIFSESLPPDLKLALSMLQKCIDDEKRKAGLPSIQHTYVDELDRLEYHSDPINQLAVIRSQFRRGHSQDTVIEKGHLRQTIAFLQQALESFEKQPKNPAH